MHYGIANMYFPLARFIHHPLPSASSASLVAGLLTKTRDLSQSPLHIFQACLDSIIVLSSTERNDTDKELMQIVLICISSSEAVFHFHSIHFKLRNPSLPLLKAAALALHDAQPPAAIARPVHFAVHLFSQTGKPDKPL